MAVVVSPDWATRLTSVGRQAGLCQVAPVQFEVRWTGPISRSGRRRRQLVGGRFVSASPAARARLRSILRFEDLTPRLRIRRITPAKPPAKRAASGRKRPH